MKRKVFNQFLTFSIGPFIGSFISMITVPVFTRIISPTEYGMLNLFTTVFSFMSIFVTFLDYGFTKNYHHFKSKNKENHILWNVVFISMLFTILLDLILFLNSEEIAVIVFKSEKYKSLIYLLSIMIIFACFDRYSQLSIRLQEKGLKFSIVNIENKLLILLLTILLLTLYPKYTSGAIVAFGLAQILTSISSFLLSKSNWKMKGVKLDFKLQVDTLVSSSPIMPSSLIMWGLSSLSMIFLSNLSTFYEVGLYSGAMKIANILTIVQTAFMSFWMPLAFKWDYKKVETSNYTKVNESLLFVLTLLLLVILFSKDLIILFLGKEFQGSLKLLPFTLFFPIMYTLSEAIGVGFALKKKVYLNLIASSTALILFIIIGLILIPLLGSLGAAISTAISYFVLFWIKILIAKKIWYNFKLNSYVINSILIIIASILNTFITNGIIYLINVFVILALLFLNKNSYIFKFIIDYIVSHKKKIIFGKKKSQF